MASKSRNRIRTPSWCELASKTMSGPAARLASTIVRSPYSRPNGGRAPGSQS